MIFTCVSLVWIILSYYGYDRYLILGLKTNYSESYLKLPRVNTKSKVIVSVSTTETDFNKIKRTINSILDQSVHPDQIILSVNPGNQIQVPDHLKKANVIIQHNLSSDYGACSCFISPLTREKDADAKLIILNDKQIYGPDLLQMLVEESDKNPDRVIYTKGYKAKNLIQNGNITDVKNDNDIIDIKGGVLVKPSFFSEDILSCNSNLKYAPNATLSAHINKPSMWKQINDDDTFNNISNNDLEQERRGAIFYAAFFETV